jgi:hypothetical protein
MNTNASWLKNNGKTLSDLGVKVAQIIGSVFRGIYHLEKEVLHKRVDWSSDHFICIVIPESLSTFDSSKLTELVVHCHNQAIRLNISGRAVSYLSLEFSPRIRDGSISKRHPSIESVIEEINGTTLQFCSINSLKLSVNELKPRLADLDRESVFEIYMEITKYLALRFDTNPIDLAAEIIEILSERSASGKVQAFLH